MSYCVCVWLQRRAGEAERVGGSVKPGEHVWNCGDAEECVWPSAAVLWAHARLPAAGWHLRQVRQNKSRDHFLFSSASSQLSGFYFCLSLLLTVPLVSCAVSVPRRRTVCIRPWSSVSVRTRRCGSATAPSCCSRATAMPPPLSWRGRCRVYPPKKVRWLIQIRLWSI